MKRFFLLLFCFVGSLSFSQKQYHFDYALIYDNPISVENETKSNLYLINSKDNSFRTLVSFEKDSINVSLRLIDYDGLFVNSNVKKEKFYEAETLSNECNSVHRFSNKYKYKIKEYNFIKHQDTIINDTVYYHYSMKCNKSLSYQKRNKIVTSHYIIDKNSEQFKPFLYHTTVYNKWVETLELPNGIIKMKYDVNVEGKIIFKQELIKVIQINKFFTIPDECDYTKSLK
ncbi:MAG: hypothetical protein RSE15_07700 [Flavobacterium sp.]|jgi:hypothetical protein|uniref:hypothetical protein n=1 Tax=Flavobacterium sp. TaxID=239 RepID=UPI002B47C302|nr:hypothetical protein [Flavobacterium sp.]WRH72248.1 MAG: hypothetical protein RSE15_07700 [Flavobacterium sp.]